MSKDVYSKEWISSIHGSKCLFAIKQLGGGFNVVSNMFFPSLFGEVIQFDEHIFQVG